MKLTFCLVILMSFWASATVHSQDARISIAVKESPISTVIRDIEKKSSYKFAYGNDLLPNKLVTLDFKDAKVSQVLDKTLEHTGINYKLLKNNLIVLVGSKPEQNVEEIRISGIVTDDAGAPLPGVTVRVKDNNKYSTATDLNGHFGITIPSKSTILLFSYIGFATREILVGDQQSIRVVLKAQPGALNEVVVIGYGTSTKRQLTGSVATIGSKEISEQPVGNVLNSMQGRMAGVQVTSSNGLPGSSVSIQIRGNNTISNLGAGSLPLYIVDGVPFTFYNSNVVPATDNLNGAGYSGANGGISPFNSLNPNDIESISVLKDADATAIYGARGGNGVVLITTKKAKAGKTRVEVNVNQGAGKVGNFIDMLSGEEYLALRKEAFANDKVTPTNTNAPDLTLWSQSTFTDWQKELIGGTAQYTDAQATLSGGDQRTTFAFNAGYHRETTVYQGDNSQNRFSGRLNVGHTSTNKKFEARLSATYSNDKTMLPTIDLASLYNLPPNYPAYKDNGQLNYVSGVTNPFSYLFQAYNTETNNLNANGQLRYTLLPGLNLKASLGYATIGLDQVRKQPSMSKNNATSTQVSTANFADSYAQSYIVEPQIDYTLKTVGGDFNILVGATMQENEVNGHSYTGTGYSSDNLLGVLSAASTVSAGSSYDKYHYNSLFGRLNYNLKGKYILNGTLRRDGSSRFGSNNRFGTFWALGGAWMFSNEAFVKENAGFLSYGKIRASYGVTGNDQILNYQYLSTYSTGGTTQSYQGTTISFPSRLANPDIQWQETNKFELALDLGFLQDRILLNAAYYKNLSNNQLLYISTGSQVGFSSYLGNFPATIENKGVELELSTTNFRTKNFRWTSSFNISIPKTTLTKFKDLETSSFSQSYVIGESPNFTRLYQYNGVDPTTGKVLYITKNSNGLPTFAVDQIIAKRGNPYYGGLNNSFSFKQFELGVFLQFNSQYGALNSITGALGSMNNQNAGVVDRWRQAGDVAYFPAASASSTSAVFNSYGFYYNSSSLFWGKSEWLKLKNVNLSYNLPDVICNKLKATNLRVYAQGQNLWVTATRKNVFDPETGTAMPALRTIVLGLNATF